MTKFEIMCMAVEIDWISISEPPPWKDKGPAHGYRCTLKFDGRESCYYKFWKGEDSPPTSAELIHSLLSDASSADSARDFEDWASDMGHNPDSREAEQTYEKIKENTGYLRDLFGSNEVFDYFMEESSEY